MSILIKKHLLEIPSYLPSRSIESVKKEFGLTEIYQLSSNENPIGASPKAISAIKENLNNIHRYPDPNATVLKIKLANKLKLSPENILVGNGAAEVIDLIISAFISPTDEILLSCPTFPKYEISTKRAQGNVVEIKMKNYNHDYEEILNCVSAKTKLIFIDTPSNPVGCFLNKREQEFLIRNLPDHVILVFDEAYREYIDEKECLLYNDFVNHRRNILFIRTFSKAYGLSGLRIGYLISHPQTVSGVNRVREVFNVNSLALIGAEAALDDEEHLQNTILSNEIGKIFLYNNLKKIGFDFLPTHANFILVNTKRPLEKVQNFLLKNGIIVRPIILNGFENCHIRVSIGKQTENEIFINAMKELHEKIPESNMTLLLKNIG